MHVFADLLLAFVDLVEIIRKVVEMDQTAGDVERERTNINDPFDEVKNRAISGVGKLRSRDGVKREGPG